MESISYDLNGHYSLIRKTYNDKPFFRKHISLEYESDFIEYIVASKIKRNPHPNLVTIYDITTSYIDMELLETDNIKKKIDFNEIKRALIHLHKLNVVYIDLKLPNIGITRNTGETKIFDFNCCGILLTNTKWLYKPVYSKPYKILQDLDITHYKKYDYIVLDIFVEKYNKKNCLKSILNIFRGD